MKYVREKLIKGNPYYYLQYELKDPTKKEKIAISKYLGKSLPSDIKQELEGFFEKVSSTSYNNLSERTKEYFPYDGVKKIEFYRFRYVLLNHELFENEFRLFRNLFNILFVLNSNRAEGSMVTRSDIERVLKRRVAPRNQIEREIVNSIDAINFAFSRDFKWNPKSIRLIHRKLLHDLSPDIAGDFKKEDNVAGGNLRGLITTTSHWQDVRKDIRGLLTWFKKEKKMTYPPAVALRFHFKFEAIHPFLNGNGRVGRILLNAFLIESGYSPVIFFSRNHRSYCNSISKARQGNEKPLAKHFVEHLKRTYLAVEEYRKEGAIEGGSPQIGRWEIHRNNIRVY